MVLKVYGAIFSTCTQVVVTTLKELKVDGGMTNGDKVMEILADYAGCTVVRPEMRECVFVPFPPSFPPSLFFSPSP